MKVLHPDVTKGIRGQHAANSVSKYAIRVPLEHLLQWDSFEAAWIQRVMYVLFVRHLVACEKQLFYVTDNDDISINLGAVVSWFVLSLKNMRKMRCQAPHNFACCIDMPPTDSVVCWRMV